MSEKKPRTKRGIAAQLPELTELREAIKYQYIATLKAIDDLSASSSKKLKQAFWLTPEHLKKSREERGITQEGLAEFTGISLSTIGNYEAGWKPIVIGNAENIYRALYAFGSKEAARALDALLEFQFEVADSVLKTFPRLHGDLNRREEQTRAIRENIAQERKLVRGILGLSAPKGSETNAGQ